MIRETLMAAECESGGAGEDAEIRWHLDPDADDTVLSSLEGEKLNEAQVQARERSRFAGANETQAQRDTRKKAGFGSANETPARRDAREKAAKKAGFGGADESQAQRDAREKARSSAKTGDQTVDLL